MNERLYTLTRVPVAVYPIIATMAVAVGFAGWFVGRLAHHPDVSWTNKNPRPYLHVKQNETIKFMNPNKRFERNWVSIPDCNMHDFAEFCLLQYYNTINWKENTYSTILKESDSILNFPIPSNVSSQFSSSSQSSKLHACASLGFPSKSSVGIIATSIPLYIPPGAYIPIFNNFNIYDKIGLGFKKALETVYSPSFFLYSRLSQDRMESLISRRFSRHDMIILSGIQKTDQSHLNIQLIHSRPNISIETLYSTTNEILGASLLTIFSNWSLGLEMFYTFLDKSGGCSIASRYRTSKTTTTFTINPIVGHLHTTFTSRINENLKATSVYGFNINSYESEVGVGVELGNEEGLLKVGCKEQGVNCVFEKRFERGGVEVGFFTGFGKDAKRSVGISFQVY